MFTPPPSPGQSPTEPDCYISDVKLDSSSGTESKKRIGRRTRWTVMVVPVVLIIITASTRYITHPLAPQGFDSVISELWSKGLDWTPRPGHLLHPRQDSQSQSQSADSSTSPSAATESPPSTTVAATAQPLPTVPSSPPVLPTPFPQPFDADLTQNFSSVSCFNFFTNMTNTTPFRSCRPFSLLLQSSAAMLNAQSNLTQMNSIVWGTCNTPVDAQQCVANMSWFAAEIKNACSADLKDGNIQARQTLAALQAYELMHDTACLVNPVTDTYCYLDAVHNNNPTDLYYYQLPLGNPLPNSAKSSCSSCTRSLMSIYGSGMDNKTLEMSGLAATYNDAAQQAITDCGQAYATLAANNGVAMFGPRTLSTSVLFLVSLLVWLVQLL